jgi:glucose/arabinose dehydrogenase
MAPFETPSFVDLQAHSAPLGLSFVPEEGWPEEYWYNLLVAYHGSWNRSVPTGYKIVRIKMNSKGEYLGTEDFITGWLRSGNEKVGRPVDIKVLPGGVVYISDDDSGTIYRLSKN